MDATLTKTERGREQGELLGLPWDLRDWLHQHQLLECIDAQLELVDWQNSAVISAEQKHPQFRPKMFLRLLTYAYSTGMYASEDIAEGCYHDELLRAISENEPPSMRAIGAFRRENRGLLQWFLMELFKQAIKRKFNAGDFLVSTGLKRSLADAAIARIDLARHMDRGAREE